VKIFDLPGLPRRLYPQLAAIRVQDGDPPHDIAFLRKVRSLGLPAADYHAVYAVEDDEILSKVETRWLTFRSPGGSKPVAGISDVTTRPTAGRRGLAGALFEEVHRREAARGVEWSFLWTHLSWGAHRLYERLGYTDVYSTPVSLRHVPRRKARAARRPTGYDWRIPTARDAGRLEQMLSQATEDRIGFLPRSPGSFKAAFELGWRTPEKLRVLVSGRERVGYANLGMEDAWSATFNEVVVTGPEHIAPMLGALEAEAQGRWLVLETTTFVNDASTLLRERGFATYPVTHRTLMAKRLAGTSERTEDLGALCRSPLFSLQRSDMF
jgi:GNAT superfamily N-acetyltransferase